MNSNVGPANKAAWRSSQLPSPAIATPRTSLNPLGLKPGCSSSVAGSTERSSPTAGVGCGATEYPKVLPALEVTQGGAVTQDAGPPEAAHSEAVFQEVLPPFAPSLWGHPGRDSGPLVTMGGDPCPASDGENADLMA